MATFHKVIKLLKQICCEFALIQMEGAIERARPNKILQQNALSRLRLPLETMQIFAADLNFKSFITL